VGVFFCIHSVLGIRVCPDKSYIATVALLMKLAYDDNNRKSWIL